MVKNSPANVGDVKDVGLILGSGRAPGGEHGNPLQYSCLENPMDKGAWWTMVHSIKNESDMTEGTEHSISQSPKVKAERRGLKQDCQAKCQISSSV